MLNLEELIPEAAEFTLKSTSRTYKMRPVSLADEVWIQQKFGDEIEDIFKKMKFDKICRIAFHLLEDKSDFIRKEISIVDEDGNEKKQSLGGAELLMAMVVGKGEQIKIVEALLQTIGLSRPVIEKLSNAMDAKKEEKKKMEAEQTGGKSSMSSQPNMDGPQNTSSPAQPENSHGV